MVKDVSKWLYAESLGSGYKILSEFSFWVYHSVLCTPENDLLSFCCLYNDSNIFLLHKVTAENETINF